MAQDQEFLFNRSGRLRIGKPGQEGKDFTGLRISFNAEKTSESNPNQGKIQVYNLSPSSRAFVEQEGLVLILDAGYAPPGEEPYLENLFTGDVKKVTNERNGTEWLTTFELGDGEKALQEAQLNKSFEAGASLTKILKDTAGTFGKAVNNLSGVTEQTLKSAVTLSGSSKDVMDKYAAAAGVDWGIQDNEVQVIGKAQTTNDPVILLTENTGLLTSPVKREKGIEMTSLLIPRLRPARRIKVESQTITGVYRVRKVTHTGDTHEGPWETKIEAVEVAS